MNTSPIPTRHQLLPTRFGVAISILLGTVAAFQSASAVVIEDFMGVKWGASMEEARRIMSAQPDVVAKELKRKVLLWSNAWDTLGFEGGRFEQWQAKEWLLGFAGSRFCAGRVTIGKSDDAVEMLARHSKAKQFLTQKYGPPTVRDDPTEKSLANKGSRFSSKWSIRTGDLSRDVTIELHVNRIVEIRVFIQFTHDQLANPTPSQPAPTATAPAAPTPYRDSLAVVVGTGFAAVKLKDGRALQGDILTEDSEQLVLQTESVTGVTLARVTLKKSEVASVDKWSRKQRLASLRSMARALQEQIKSCRDTSNQAAKEQADAERKAEHYRIYMAKTHGNSGTLTELQMNARSAKTKAATAGKQKQQLESQKQAIEQKIAQVHD
ncbi:MAG: hypothetical protein NTY01_11410 [Verrucomicrobia bacterium]|nr:hypothetical protein [Verrucomicrobiota bacterium]